MADIISRLKLESGEFDSKIKRAAQGINQMVAEARKMNSTLINAVGNTEEEVKANMKYIQSLGRMETVSQTARGKLAELTAGFTDLRHAYNQLSQEEKSGNVGRELNKQLEILKQRIAESKNEIKGIEQELNGSNSKFGEFGNIIDTVGQKFGVSGNLTEMLTSKTAMLTGAVGAGIAIVTKATEAWAGYNAELAKQDQITTVTTGLKGDAADQMTNQARALVDTYNVDFRESINAANTLMTQFGESGEQAMQLIKDGMQGMIQGDGPKLLQMIQQYAPAFRDAGISASQLVAVIQNSEGGIFTDQNMNAIVMGIKNIRLMTKATSDALAQLGIDGQKMSQQLSDGSLTIFDALKQVASAVQNVNSNSQAAGEVMQQVFGRQGAMAGTKLGEAIATLNTNLEETKRQTGELGDAYNDLYNANVKLNGAIRDCFEYDGWDQMATGIKAKLVSALASVLDYIGRIKGALGGFSVNQQQGGAQTGGGANMDRMIAMLGDGKSPKAQQTYTRQIQEYTAGIFRINDQIRQIQEKAAQDMDGNMAVVYEKQIRNLENRKQAIQRNMAEYDKRAQAVLNGTKTMPAPVINPITNITPKGGNGGRTTNQPTYDKGSLAEQQAEVQRLTKLWQESGEAIRDQYLQPLVEAEKKLQQMKDLMDMQKDLTMGKFSGEGAEDFRQSMRDAKGLTESIDKNNHMLLDDKALSKAFAEAQKQPKKKEEKEEKKYLSEGLSQLSGGLSGLQSGFSQLGIDLGEGFGSVVQGLSGISSILMAIQTIVGAIEAIGAADAIIPFAGGGTVPKFANSGVVPKLIGKAAGGMLIPGNSFSGDNLRMTVDGGRGVIGVNSGELILNMSSQNNLASALKNAQGLLQSINVDRSLSRSQQNGIATAVMGGGMQNLHLETYLDGRAIRIVLNNESQGRLKGKYVTSRRG